MAEELLYWICLKNNASNNSCLYYVYGLLGHTHGCNAATSLLSVKLKNTCILYLGFFWASVWGDLLRSLQQQINEIQTFKTSGVGF